MSVKHRVNSKEEAPPDVKPAANSGNATPASKKGRIRPYFRKVAKFRPYSILDSPEWTQSTFYGFYVMFWVLLFTHNSRILLLNYLGSGTLLQTQVINTLLCDCWHVALIDFVMYLLMYPTYFFQKLVAKDVVNWDRWGWIAQHLYQAAFLAFFVIYARVVDFPWIGRIFLALHALVQMMKMHSFAVFNGALHHFRKQIEENKKTSKLTQELVQEMEHQVSIYPRNLTLKNFFMFTMFPTVVYEIEYPRTDRIRWGFAARKIAATLGIFLCMIVIAQHSLHPIVIRANMLRQQESLWNRFRLYPLIILEVLPPFILIYILTFYIIWDAILNSIAELSMYGDREFYRDWWNSNEWAKFARDWNVPVHNFLQRHVYTSSRLFLKLSRMQAMFFTFFFSSLVHELAMWVIFGRIRGYLLLMQLTQLPMQFISEAPFFKKRSTLGLVMFWLGMVVGPSLICSLYLTF